MRIKKSVFGEAIIVASLVLAGGCSKTTKKETEKDKDGKTTKTETTTISLTKYDLRGTKIKDLTKKLSDANKAKTTAETNLATSIKALDGLKETVKSGRETEADLKKFVDESEKTGRILLKIIFPAVTTVTEDSKWKTKILGKRTGLAAENELQVELDFLDAVLDYKSKAIEKSAFVTASLRYIKFIGKRMELVVAKTTAGKAAGSLKKIDDALTIAKAARNTAKSLHDAQASIVKGLEDAFKDATNADNITKNYLRLAAVADLAAVGDPLNEATQNANYVRKEAAKAAGATLPADAGATVIGADDALALAQVYVNNTESLVQSATEKVKEEVEELSELLVKLEAEDKKVADLETKKLAAKTLSDKAETAEKAAQSVVTALAVEAKNII